MYNTIGGFIGIYNFVVSIILLLGVGGIMLGERRENEQNDN